MPVRKHCGNCYYTPRDFNDKRKPCRPCWAPVRYNLWKPITKAQKMKK